MGGGSVSVDRDTKRLLYCIISGVVAVAYNIDHLICAVRYSLPLLPFSGLYGCKATPAETLSVAGGVAWLIGTCWLGLVGVAIYKAAKRAT